MHKTKQNKNIGVICSQSAWTKYYVIRVNERERQTKHSCNGAPRRWVINLTARAQTTTELHSRWAFSILSSKKCQAAVSNNCCNPGDDKRRGRKPKHLSHLVLTPSLNTHQFLLLVAFPFMRACTHTHSLHVSVSHYDQTRPETKPCCASVRQSPIRAILWPYKNWRWSSPSTEEWHKSRIKPWKIPPPKKKN